MAVPDARCSALSRGRDELLAGTASRVVRWVVIEQPGPWGRDALVESRLDEWVGRVLQSATPRHGFRALLARRPGWRASEGPRRVYLARTLRQGGWIEQLDLDDVRQVAELPWDVLERTEPPGIGQPGPPSIHLVCTNGKHDPCCADLGRPVVRALRDAGTAEVWESSHVGGDRFAANVVCLPTGVYFGRVEPTEAAALLEEFSRGLLRLERYRGRSCYSALTQAAEYFARLELGERRLDGLRVASARRLPGGIEVHLEHDGGLARAVVSRRRALAESLSCGAAPSRPWSYRLESFTTLAG